MSTNEQTLQTISLNDKLILLAASILALWVSYQLFYKVYEIDPGENAIELGSIETTGVIRRRHAKSLAWGNVKGSSKLYLRDIVITPKDVGATVTWGKNQSLFIEPDTMVQFDEVTSDRVQIVLFEGKVKQEQKNLAAPVHRVVVKTEEMVRIIPYPKTVQLQEVVHSDNGERILSNLQQKFNETIKKQVVLYPLNGVRDAKLVLDKVTDYQIRLLSPARQQFNLSQNKWILFSWNFPKIEGVEYQLEISKERDFERALTHKTTKQELELQIEDPAAYYWRVRAMKQNESVLSLISTFEMFNQSGADAYNRIPTGAAPGFSWEIATDDQFTSVIKNGVAKVARCKINELPPRTYYCRVRNVTSNQVVRKYSVELK